MQTGNVQFEQSGDSPRRTLASVDFPVPVWPTITNLGSGNSSKLTIGNKERMMNKSLTMIDSFLITELKISSWAP